MPGVGPGVGLDPPLIITGVCRPPLLRKDSRFFQANIAPFNNNFQYGTKHIHTNFQVQEKFSNKEKLTLKNPTLIILK